MIEEIKINENALTVLQSRYLLKDKEGNVAETPDEMFWRVAQFISKAELLYGNGLVQQKFWEEKFYNLLSSFLFLPNSPTLMNAGVHSGQLSACYVLPLSDINNPIDIILNYALVIQKWGGGTGFNFSYLSKKEKQPFNTAISCIQEFNNAMESIKKKGKRSGANMAILNINHAEIESFINSKINENALKNFNISVGVTNDYMQCLLKDGYWQLRDPLTNAVVKEIKAKKLWEEIAYAAWKTGDPGLIFLDAIAKTNPTPVLGSLNATNPCGEVPLLSYEACNLGSINLSLMIKQQRRCIKLDWEKLKTVIHSSIRFLDNVIDMNSYYIPEIERIVKGNRKIGLGVMGWADLLVRVGLRYDSEEAVMLGKKIMKFIQEESYKASAELAKERGVFPNWGKSKYCPSIPLRNATLNSIAPTGTISIIAGTSPSIEPFFGLSFSRKNILDGKEIYETNSLLENYFYKYKIEKTEIVDLVKRRGFFTESDKVPPLLKELFKTSLQIPYKYHLKHQAAFQKYTDNAVSKTINLPEDTTAEDISYIFMAAWKKHLKGITIYRYGSKENQVIYQGKEQALHPSEKSKLCNKC